MATCDVCRKRRAVYLRTYSGHKLCPICLEKVLMKAVKKSINLAKILKPNSKLGYMVRPSDPSTSISALVLTSRVESKFNVEIKVFLPIKIIENDNIKRALKRANKYVKIELLHYNFPKIPTLSLHECIRYERRLALELSRSYRVDSLLFPLNKTISNLLGLEALLTGNPEGLSEVLPFIHWTSPPIISPISRIEAEALTAYAFLEKFIVDPLCTTSLSSKIPFHPLMGSHPELEFSSHKTLEKIARQIANTWRKCPYCGGFSRRGGQCSYCKRVSALIQEGS